LTELTVQKAKPQQRVYLVWDSYQRGLALQVQPTGSKAWKCIYSRHGRPRWLHLGDAGVVNLAKARLLAGKAMLAVAEGATRPPTGEPSAPSAALPICTPSISISTPRSRIGRGRKPTLKIRSILCLPKPSLVTVEPKVLRKSCGVVRSIPAKSITRSDVKALMAKISIGSVYDRHGYSAEDQRIMEACSAHFMILVEGRDDAKVIPFGR
jgi:hypothetical protein